MRKFFVCIVVACLMLSGLSVSGAEFAVGETCSNQTEELNAENSYQTNRTQYASQPASVTDIRLKGSSFAKKNEVAQTSTPGIYQEKREVLLWENSKGWIEWNVNIPNDGIYNMGLVYQPLEGTGTDIKLSMLLDGQSPLGEDYSYSFKRAWKDVADIQRDANGNDIRPAVKETFLWLYQDFQEYEPFSYYFEKGTHTIRIQAVCEPLAIAELRVYNPVPAVSYEQYKKVNQNKIALADHGYFKMIPAETPNLKSDSMLYAVSDRTSPNLQPSDPSKVRLNTIGGSGWKYAGQWLQYNFDVPEDGFYEIGISYKQDAVRGLFTSRKVCLDNKMIFSELAQVRFTYTTKWKQMALGGETPYQFYLNKGSHSITFQVTLGEMQGVVEQVLETLSQLNQAYRDVIMVTGTTPDLMRDYQLDKEVDGLTEVLAAGRDSLRRLGNELESITGQKGSDSSLLFEIANQLDSFLKKPESIPERLTNFRDNLSALGAWVLRIKEQPLQMDYLYVKSPESAFPDELQDKGFFARLWFEVRALVGSFFEDYSSVGTREGNKESIRVWVGSGREQAEILKRLVDESFTPNHDISVDINLVQGSLVQATLAKQSPDVILGVGRGEPINLAIRGAISPLDDLEGFKALKDEYSSDDFAPYEINGRTYAIPETKNFYMMFYRKDVFAQLNLTPPQTWDEFYKLIPVLQRNNMQIGLPYVSMDAYSLVGSGMGAQNIYTALLYQNGGCYYNTALSATALDSTQAVSAFEKWTELYTKYGFPLYYDFLNRFRTGEMPLGIQLYTTYNTLDLSAPEINNLWDMVPIPGIREADGTINRKQGSTGTATILLNNSKHKQSAWEFIKWWTSAPVQAKYGRDMEQIIGPAARYNPASLQALSQIPWGTTQAEAIREQWQQIVAIPEIPGGYYTSRNIDNAFKTVVLNGGIPREELLKWSEDTDIEITRKRQEFGLE